MSTLLKKARSLATSAQTADKKKEQEAANKKKWKQPKVQVVSTSYNSLPVDIPESFLAPLEDPSRLEVKQIDFATSAIPEYRGLYAVVIDNLLTQEECNQLMHLAEQSAGAHREGAAVEDNGWKPAMVNAGPGVEFMMSDYRNSDRIVWDQDEIARRLWARCSQAEEVREELTVLQSSEDENHYATVLGPRRGRNWILRKQGLNERLRFLRYGAGQFFREHCDGHYATPDGVQTSFYTFHLYLNDSIQVLQTAGSEKKSVQSFDRTVCAGGATTFHSPLVDRSVDVDPKAGRVLIFQQERLLHSGADVTGGIKYTIRSDLMYEIS
ncbi:oxidoreductase domain containing protein [Phlyctema vagabunda]|uniref:Oxidoreductase domain containing protein n=1 Tax=Phlyctema vagabunda TaxID=108571 RepID=A0ABR4PGD4_9HELO